MLGVATFFLSTNTASTHGNHTMTLILTIERIDTLITNAPISEIKPLLQSLHEGMEYAR